ncbi:hypothetical protein [Sphingomonas sp. BK580]|uniref:hypothetical protein n=1 Tax=Sphingomonas sp. BK580 TaxID=2586972 RepID=UPI001619C62B|nr:hypothetical protein [Sphingomonas sp. BK580]MBB3695866.1 hypothetical protein [Sphingomonas sp. BK580]
MSPILAGKILLSIAAIMPATGAIALNWACYRQRSYWTLAVGLVVYNLPFLLGFINFQIGVGIALWGSAIWIWMARRQPVAGIGMGVLFGLATFFSHLFAFGFYALLIGCWEFATVVQRGWRSHGIVPFAIRHLGSAAIALIPPLILYVASPLAGTEGAVIRRGWATKLSTLSVPVAGYSPLLTYGILTALGAIFAALLVTRRLQIAPFSLIAFPLLTLIFLVLPTGAKGVYYIDTRIPVMMGFLLFAATLPRLPRPIGAAVALAIAALFVVRIALIGRVWIDAQQDVSDVRAVLASVTPGSRVLAVDASSNNLDTAILRSRLMAYGYPNSYWHYAALAFIDRRAFWADAFTLYGQQPVIATPPYQQSSNPGGFPMQDISALASQDPRPKSQKPEYLTNWETKFDYILVMNADSGRNLPTTAWANLHLVSRQRFAMLLKVVR